jgi:hypothetical protein
VMDLLFKLNHKRFIIGVGDYEQVFFSPRFCSIVPFRLPCTEVSVSEPVARP